MSASGHEREEREEISDRDVGEYSISGADVPGHRSARLSRLWGHGPSTKTRRSDVV